MSETEQAQIEHGMTVRDLIVALLNEETANGGVLNGEVYVEAPIEGGMHFGPVKRVVVDEYGDVRLMP